MGAIRTLLCVALMAVASVAAAAPVRIFAIGHKQRLTDVVTYATFHDKMAALMDGAFPGRATRVQSGGDDVLSHIQPADPLAPARVLVAFPEDTGLAASFIGTRGTLGRGAPNSVGAIVGLVFAYGPVNAYYQAKFPGQPVVRTLGEALTDT